jgi:CheY-like chemotaxis protein
MIDVGHQPSATKTRNKLSILLMDGNSGRRALRKRIMALHGVEVVGACDLTEAASIWRRDRYDAVLIDIRRDHHGCIAWRDEVKKEKPQLAGSYVAEEQAAQWGDSLRKAIRERCASLPLCGYWRLRKQNRSLCAPLPSVRRTTDRYRSTRVSRPDSIQDNGRSGDETTRFPTLL